MNPLAALAVLAASIGGGTYQGKVDTGPCDKTCVAKLVVVDDGRSLSTKSIVGAPCDLAETTDADSQPAPRGTAVKTDGSFRWRTHFQVVEGRFAADGRSVSGSARFLGRARDDCSAATTTFTAPLVRHAKANGRCESPAAGRLEVAVFVRRTGCTKAGRVVDAWSARRACKVSSCRAGGRRCDPVLGGRLNNLTGVACVAGRSRIELVLRQSCGGQGPASGYSTTAINLRCVDAQAVTNAWARSAGCQRHGCTVAGYSCKPVQGKGPLRRCRRGHLGVDIWRQVLVFD
jgi:hypothetical protein